jgi:hypothetical protein
MPKLYATLNNSAGELDSREIETGPDDDSAEVSEAIWDTINDWILAPGDTIRIIEREPVPEGVTVVSLDRIAELHATLKTVLGE